MCDNLTDVITVKIITEENKRNICNMNGKYIKIILSRLEQQFAVTKEMRKIILDSLNEYARELNEELAL